MLVLRKFIRTQSNSTADTNRRAISGVITMTNSMAVRPTAVVSKTDVVHEIRAAVSAALIKFPTKSIEGWGDLTEEGVRLLKNGKRTISMETIVKMARSRSELSPTIWAVICELCGRKSGFEQESPRLNSLFGALERLSRSNSPEGAFAAALMRHMNSDATAPRDQPAPDHGYDPNGAIYNLFPERRRA